MSRRSIQELRDGSLAKRLSVFALIAGALGLVAVAERDIQRRQADQVRGSKTLWRLASLNALGAASYLLWGRRAELS